ncbi:hypothetical protein [Nocardioides sp. cx-173]|uniref:hypothetical protein n=1 Tax=Nocardioides sp. cx-173 TaxID=2898796 RepID=UPI001E2BA124|nr:hypothetical protein [Nocardioides sp. cx-173]MCD4525537.1 hypothetical protein [Nocardioides sp. cx-173]UGB42681.1 hypothetical protein LQ940_03940 [Nocardioides sp. cx-173]
MRLAPTVAVAVLIAVLSGCAGESKSEAEVSDEARETCELLSADDLVALAGKDLGEPEPGEVTGLPTCRWGSPADAGVQVIDVPVADWVANLGPALDGVEQELGDDPVTGAKIEEARRILASGEVDDAEGCELFSLFVELQGLGPDLERVVNVIPSREAPEAVTAQACGGGRFTSVLLQGPGVTGSDAEVDRVDAALDVALGRSGE